jgi:hypothetical protein
MSVAYEPRNFINEGAYPPMADEHDHDHDHSHVADQRFTDNDVAEQLSQYTTEANMLPDDREVLGDDRGLLPDDATAVQDAQLDLPDGFESPIEVTLQAPHMSDPLPDSKDPSPSIGSPPSGRSKGIPKPERDPVKLPDGKFHCPLEDCKEDTRAFTRKCEWK